MSESNDTASNEGTTSEAGFNVIGWLPGNSKLSASGKAGTDTAKAMFQGIGSSFGDVLSSAGNIKLKGVVPGIGNNNLRSSTTEIRPKSAGSTVDGVGDVNEISKDDLLQLCMKLQGRLKVRESKQGKLMSAYKVKREDADTLETILSVISPLSERLSALQPKVHCDASAFVEDEQKEKATRLELVDEYVAELKKALEANVGGVAPKNSQASGSDDEPDQRHKTREQRSGSQPELWNRVVELEQQLKQQNGELNIDTSHNQAVKCDEVDGSAAKSPVAAAGVAADLRAQLETAQSECKYWQQQSQSLETRIKQMKDQAAQEATGMESLEDNLHEAQERILELQMELNKQSEWKNEAVAQEEKHKEQSDELLELEAKVTGYEQQLEDSQQMHREVSAELVEVKKKLLTASIEHEEIVAERNILRDQLVEVRANSTELSTQIQNLQDEIQSLTDQTQRDGRMLSKLTTQLGNANERLMDQGSKVDELEAELLQQQEELKSKLAENESALGEEAARLEAVIADCRTELSSAKEVEQELREELAKVEANVVETASKHTKALQRVKEEETKKSKIARQMLEKQENELSTLRSRMEELQDEVNLGKPSERRLFEFAQAQASRENDIKVHVARIQELESEQASLKASLKEAKEEVKHLHHSILVTQSDSRRNTVDMVYLKNVIISYMMFDVTSSERRSLRNVIAAILEFSQEELEKTNPKTSWWESLTGQAEGESTRNTMVPPRLLPRRDAVKQKRKSKRKAHGKGNRSSSTPIHVHQEGVTSAGE